jgi:hypothetical protein
MAHGFVLLLMPYVPYDLFNSLTFILIFDTII